MFDWQRVAPQGTYRDMKRSDILKYFEAKRTIEIEAGKDIRDFLKQNDLLAVLKSGEVEFVSAGGQTTVRLAPGTPLGMLRAESPDDLGRVTAVSRCELIPLDEQSVANLVKFNPRFASDLLGVMQDTVHDLVKLLP